MIIEGPQHVKHDSPCLSHVTSQHGCLNLLPPSAAVASTAQAAAAATMVENEHKSNLRRRYRSVVATVNSREEGALERLIGLKLKLCLP